MTRGLSGKDEFATSASAIKQPKQVPIVPTVQSLRSVPKVTIEDIQFKVTAPNRHVEGG
jgi:hypothetical protein